MTFKEIQDEVLGNENFSDAVYRGRIKNYVNEGMRRIARSVQIPQLWANTTLVTTPGASSAALPADFVRFSSLTDVANQRPLKRMRPDVFDAAPATSGPPIFYALGTPANADPSRAWVIYYPTPDAAYSLALRYYQEAPSLTADADTPQLPAAYHDLLVTYASMRAYRAENDYQAASALLADWQRDLMRLGVDLPFTDAGGGKQVAGMWNDYWSGITWGGDW